MSSGVPVQGKNCRNMTKCINTHIVIIYVGTKAFDIRLIKTSFYFDNFDFN